MAEVAVSSPSFLGELLLPAAPPSRVTALRKGEEDVFSWISFLPEVTFLAEVVDVFLVGVVVVFFLIFFSLIPSLAGMGSNASLIVTGREDDDCILMLLLWVSAGRGLLISVRVVEVVEDILPDIS